MKKFFYLSFVVVLLSCGNNSNDDTRQKFDELASMIHQDFESTNKYVCGRPAEGATSFDVMVKKGEKLEFIQVVSDRHNVDDGFSSDGELSRVYVIRFKGEEEAESWRKSGIKTQKRFIKLNFVQE